MRTLLTATLILAACTTAQAQTPQQANLAWDTPLGRTEFVREDGRFGVFQYPLEYGDNIGRLYIDGLSGEFGGNGPLDGYWSEPDISHDDDAGDTLICPFPITDGEGRMTHNWGRIRIIFTDVDFPSDFVLLRGRCFTEPVDVIPGKRLN
ncbi:MAG TPA: hypothetical protein PLN33_09395 [Hyphomonadaceae bacterium]|nr:hypothetical protein [Hyphomonadaceae bacterium]HPN05769.1 hypothetical protein [Hyphomonadaceae bacterium]